MIVSYALSAKVSELSVEIAPHGATYISDQMMLVVMVEFISSYRMR